MARSIAVMRIVLALALLLPLPAVAGPPTAMKAPPQPATEARAEALLAKVEARMRSLKSLSGACSYTLFLPADGKTPARQVKNVSTIRLMRPNFLNTETTRFRRNKNSEVWQKSKYIFTHISDGKTFYSITVPIKTYEAEPAKPDGNNLLIPNTTWREFFASDQSFYLDIRQQRKAGNLLALRYGGKRLWEGAAYQIVEYEEKGESAGDPFRFQGTLYIGADNIIHRYVYKIEDSDGIATTEEAMRHVRLNPDFTASTFKVTLPPGAQQAKEKEAPALLAAGTVAPDFTVKDPNGKPVKLSDYRGKVVVLDFWATWCAPCMESLPDMAERAKQWAGKNVVVLAINVWDEEKSFQRWLPRHPEFKALTFAIDPTKGNKDVASLLYKVSGIPTRYVVGKDGKIVISTVGAGGPPESMLDEAIEKAVRQ